MFVNMFVVQINECIIKTNRQKDYVMDRVKNFLKVRLGNMNYFGFSLIELVTAVGMLLILTVGGTIAYSGIKDNARKAEEVSQSYSNNNNNTSNAEEESIDETSESSETVDENGETVKKDFNE